MPGPLGRDKGASKSEKLRRSPKRPGKERLKESQISVQSNRLTPIPTVGQKSYGKRGYKPQGMGNSFTLSESTWRENTPRGGRVSPRKGSFREKSKRKVIYRKMVIDHELWNLRRSPHLKQLKRAILQVKRRRNPFFKFKNLFRKVKVRNPGDYSRYNTILKGGIFLTRKSIGIKVGTNIRKAKKLSYRDLEILISKLPFWATSYRYRQMTELAYAIIGRRPRETRETLSLPSAYKPPPGPRKSWGAHPRSNQTMLENPY